MGVRGWLVVAGTVALLVAAATASSCRTVLERRCLEWGQDPPPFDPQMPGCSGVDSTSETKAGVVVLTAGGIAWLALATGAAAWGTASGRRLWQVAGLSGLGALAIGSYLSFFFVDPDVGGAAVAPLLFAFEVVPPLLAAARLRATDDPLALPINGLRGIALGLLAVGLAPALLGEMANYAFTGQLGFDIGIPPAAVLFMLAVPVLALLAVYWPLRARAVGR